MKYFGFYSWGFVAAIYKPVFHSSPLPPTKQFLRKIYRSKAKNEEKIMYVHVHSHEQKLKKNIEKKVIYRI